MIQNPYYGLHQILTGQYTPGGEFIKSNLNDYIGGYHILPNGQIFTEFKPTDKSEELFKKVFNLHEDVKIYNKNKSFIVSKYVPPVPKIIKPSLDEYELGFFYRYFVQKRNSPLNTIMEIDVDQFNSINSRNQIGINEILYNSISIKWKISGANVIEHNKLNIQMAEKLTKFKNLLGYITNFSEYYK